MRPAWGCASESGCEVWGEDGGHLGEHVPGEPVHDLDGNHIGEVDRWCFGGTCTLHGPMGEGLGEEADPDWVAPSR